MSGPNYIWVIALLNLDSVLMSMATVATEGCVETHSLG